MKLGKHRLSRTRRSLKAKEKTLKAKLAESEKELLIERLLRKRIERQERNDSCDGCGEQCGCD